MSEMMDRLQADVKAAMLAKDNVKRDTLRGVVSEVKNMTVNAGKPVTDEACMKALKKAAKQREDSIASFKAGGREDLAAKEAAELEVVKSYLPKAMSEDETRKLVAELAAKACEDAKCSMDGLKKLKGVLMKQMPPEVDKRLAAKLLDELSSPQAKLENGNSEEGD